MSNESEIEMLGGNVPVTIDLGAIELALSDLLALRPGMTVSFARPQIFEASLKIAERAWADAELSLDGEQITISIREILPLQETLAEKPRLSI